MAALEERLGVFEQQLLGQRTELEARLAEFERRIAQQAAETAQRIAQGEGAVQQLTVQVAAAAAREPPAQRATPAVRGRSAVAVPAMPGKAIQTAPSAANV